MSKLIVPYRSTFLAPYGVRAGAKTLGRKDPTKQATEPRMAVNEGVHSHLYVIYQDVGPSSSPSIVIKPLMRLKNSSIFFNSLPDYVPPTKPYEMTEVVADLLMFAVKNLVRGGRLVYWLPTVTEDYSIDDLPTHPCMELVANCEQAFGQWSRRLITMEKVKDWDGLAPLGAPLPSGEMNKSKTGPSQQGHFGFRDRYFAFSAVENAKRKKDLKEAFQRGGKEAVAAYMRQLEENKKKAAAEAAEREAKNVESGSA